MQKSAACMLLACVKMRVVAIVVCGWQQNNLSIWISVCLCLPLQDKTVSAWEPVLCVCPYM